MSALPYMVVRPHLRFRRASFPQARRMRTANTFRFHVLPRPRPLSYAGFEQMNNLCPRKPKGPGRELWILIWPHQNTGRGIRV